VSLKFELGNAKDDDFITKDLSAFQWPIALFQIIQIFHLQLVQLYTEVDAAVLGNAVCGDVSSTA
jgi:hypothetical protein